MFNGTLKVGNEYELNNGEVWECELTKDGQFALGGNPYFRSGSAMPPTQKCVRQCVKGTLADIDVKPGDVVGHVAYFDGRDDIFQGELVINSELCPCAFGGEMFRADSRSIFRLISRAAKTADTPTVFGDMTDAEKGALLLAQHKGHELQALAVDHDCSSWVNKTKLPFYSHIAYRVKPEPTTETRTLYMGADMRNALEYGSDNDACKLHYDIIDGKPCNPRFEAVE